VKESARERILNKKAFDIIERMKSIWEFIKKKLGNAQKSQKRYADQKKISSFEYFVEDIVWLFIKNIKIERLSRKLDYKWIDFYKIQKILREVCQLNLSQSMKIHDTFHTFLLRLAVTNSLINQIQSSSSSVIVDEKEEYEINDILDSRYHYEKLQYKVAWIDHLLNRAWYSTEKFQGYSKEFLQRLSSKILKNWNRIYNWSRSSKQCSHSESKLNIEKQNNWFRTFSMRWKRRWNKMTENGLIRAIGQKYVQKRLENSGSFSVDLSGFCIQDHLLIFTKRRKI
jgi:hypothetical protein